AALRHRVVGEVPEPAQDGRAVLIPDRLGQPVGRGQDDRHRERRDEPGDHAVPQPAVLANRRLLTRQTSHAEGHGSPPAPPRSGVRLSTAYIRLPVDLTSETN